MTLMPKASYVPITVGTPEGDPTQCPDCGHNAVVRIPLHGTSSDGVKRVGQYEGCGRCLTDRK